MFPPNVSLSEADLAFQQAIKILSDIKLVCGGQALYATLRKRKALKRFLEDYVKQHHALTLDTLEETIASL